MEKVAPPDFSAWTFIESCDITITLTNKRTGEALKAVWDKPDGEGVETNGLVPGTAKFYRHPTVANIRGELYELKCGAKLAEWGFEDERDKWQSLFFNEREWVKLKHDQKVVFQVEMEKCGDELLFTVRTIVAHGPLHKQHFEVEVLKK